MSKREVCIKVKHRAMSITLTPNALQLIADALEIVNPDSEEEINLAKDLAASFRALSEYIKPAE